MRKLWLVTSILVACTGLLVLLAAQHESSSSWSPGSSSCTARRLQQQAQNSTEVLLPDEQDPTQRTEWDAEPSFASHYASEEQRPNLCKVAHKVPAPLGRDVFNFTEAQKDYIPYIGTSVVRDSQLMLLRLYYRLVLLLVLLGGLFAARRCMMNLRTPCTVEHHPQLVMPAVCAVLCCAAPLCCTHTASTTL